MKKDPRRLRLLAAACVRQVIPVDASPLIGQVIDVVERYADGAATRAEFLAARKAARKAIKDKIPGTRALEHLADDAMEALTLTIEIVRTRSGGAAQCGLMRCVFGNPYRPAVFEPAWRTSTVVAVARGIYEERGFDRMPILADALQDAECEDEAILTHCRVGGPHARGRWAIDGLLRQ